MDDKAILDGLVAKIKARRPNFEIRYKDESFFQKILGTIMFFNRAYMTSYITTMFGKVYFPTRASVEDDPRGAWKVLAHEYVHLLDDKDHPVKFNLTYLAPQIYALGSLLTLGAFWNLWFLLALFFLVFSAPWGSKGRTKWEMRGYAMSIAVNFWRYGTISQSQKDYIGEHFWGPAYYYMCRDKAKVAAQLDAIEDALLRHEATTVTHPLVVLDVKAVLREQGVLKEPALA